MLYEPWPRASQQYIREKRELYLSLWPQALFIEQHFHVSDLAHTWILHTVHSQYNTHDESKLKKLLKDCGCLSSSWSNVNSLCKTGGSSFDFVAFPYRKSGAPLATTPLLFFCSSGSRCHHVVKVQQQIWYSLILPQIPLSHIQKDIRTLL